MINKDDAERSFNLKPAVHVHITKNGAVSHQNNGKESLSFHYIAAFKITEK